MCLRIKHVKFTLIRIISNKAELGAYPIMEYIIPPNRRKFGSNFALRNTAEDNQLSFRPSVINI